MRGSTVMVPFKLLECRVGVAAVMRRRPWRLQRWAWLWLLLPGRGIEGKVVVTGSAAVVGCRAQLCTYAAMAASGGQFQWSVCPTGRCMHGQGAEGPVRPT